jgi:hypothetical protein
MATHDWRSPDPLAGDPLSASPSHPSILGYELRPLTVGEVLDRVFSLYRSHFWLLAGLSAASAGVNAAIGILRLVYAHFAHLSIGSPSYAVIVGISTLLQVVLYLVAYSVTLAATTFAVNAFYLGQTTTLGVALRVAQQIWLRCLGITMWQTWSAMWVFLVVVIPLTAAAGFAARAGAGGVFGFGLIFGLGMVASVVYGVIAYLRNSLALPAAVVENLPVRAAMRRSKNLSAGRIGRIFLLLLLVYALWVVATAVQLPFIFLAARAGAAQQFVMQGAILAINFLVTTVVGPIAAIGLCLFYFDERVRREGFDIEMLLQGATVSLPLAAPPPEAVVPADSANGPQPTAEQI